MFSVLTQIKILILSLALSFTVYAQTVKAPVLKKKQVIAAPTPVPKKWKFELNSKYQFSLHTDSDAFKESSVVSALGINFLPSEKLRIQGQLGVSQGIKPRVVGRFYNPELRAFYALSPKTEKLKFYIGPTAVLPIGTDAFEESLNFGLGAAGRMLVDLRDEEELGFRSFYDINFSKNFHRYETNVFAVVNTQFTLNHTLYFEYTATPEWGLNATFGFSSMWSYFNVLSNNYTVEQEIDYSANDWLTLYVSHIRGGDFLSANGQSYSFGLFNKDSSRVALGCIISF